MTGKTIMGIIAVLMLLFLSGCKKEVPTCSDEKTLLLVKHNILGQIEDAGGLDEQEAIGENLKFGYAMANAHYEKIRKYRCEANLIVAGEYQQLIRYESRLDDKKRHIVSVAKIFRRNLWRMAGILNNARQNTEEVKKQKPAGKEAAEALSPAETEKNGTQKTDSLSPVRTSSVW